MIKEIKIYSRFEMEQVAKGNLTLLYTYWYLISIHDGDALITKYTRKVFESIGCKGMISLDFADMTPKDQGIVLDNNPQAILFNNNYARKIINFLDTIQKDIMDSTLVVHCHAGISRSGAVGAFACDYCGLNFNEFISKNSQIQPNPHVTRVLRTEAKMNPTFGTDIDSNDRMWLERINRILEEKRNG